MSLLESMPPAHVEPRYCERRVSAEVTGDWSPPPALRLQDDDLPLDPRVWSRGEVARWVRGGGGRAERFPMNGKALCLMTRDMFAARVPPRTAHALHQDFRRRLARALALQDLVEEMTAK